MIIQITGVTSGTSPYDVFLCDTGYTSCFLISGSCQIPPTVVVNTDYFFPNYYYVGLKLVDTNGCIFTQNQVCIPAPTPTPTVSPTPTSTPTSTPTPTTSPTPTPTPTPGLTVNLWDQYRYGNSGPFTSFNTVANFSQASTLFCSLWSGTSSFAGSGARYDGTLGVGTYLGNFFTSTPFNNGNYVIGNFPGISGSTIYWVEITGGTGIISFYQQIPPTCPTPTPTPTSTPTPTPTSTPTSTPTPTPTATTDPKFVIANSFDSDDYYVYDVGTNTETGPITLSGFTQIGSIANTNTKFWINPPDGAIDEWNLTLSPVVATYNRGITNPLTYSTVQGLEAFNDGRLIASLYVSGDGETQIFEVNISSSAATYTKITALTGALSGNPFIYDIALSTTGDFIVLGGNGVSSYLQQYVYSANSTLDFELNISSSIPSPIGIIGYNNYIYVMSSDGGGLYKVNLTTPYGITLAQTSPRVYASTSQSPGSVTTAFIS
jgi:hypothetical protein